MTTEIDITPKTHALASLRRQDMPPWLAVCELVDNSLDAQAVYVHVGWNADSKCLWIRDDGIGAPNPAAIVTIGAHDSEERNTSGRYGIGAKDAVLSLGTAVEVHVVRNGLHRVVRADFEEIRISGRWVAREDQREARSDEPCGTMLKVIGVDKRIVISKVEERLATTFAPALRKGGRIFLDGDALVAPPEVEVEDRRQGSGEFRGKQYSWWAGVRKSCDGIDGGWRFEFKHRMLREDSSNRAYGTGDLDIHRFYGVITLLEPEKADPEEKWMVNKHKTSADELQDLCEHIFPEVSELLERSAAEHSITLEAEVAEDVSRGLSDALSSLRTMREKRDRVEEGQTGTVEPRQTGIRRRRAAKVQHGDGSISVRDPLSGKKFAIKFVDDHRLGWVTGSRTANVVYLGRLHPYWDGRSQDREVVRCSAMFLLAGHAITTNSDSEPVMQAVVECEDASRSFFQTASNIATQVVSADQVEAVA